MSLSTLSLGELWINRQSQEIILAEVQRINRAIRATEIFSGRTETRTRDIRELPLISTPQLDMPPADGEARSVLAKEIREWRETAEYGLGCFVFFSFKIGLGSRNGLARSPYRHSLSYMLNISTVNEDC